MPGNHFDEYERFNPRNPSLIIDYQNPQRRFVRFVDPAQPGKRMYDDNWPPRTGGGGGPIKPPPKPLKDRRRDQAKRQNRSKNGRFRKGFKHGGPRSIRFDRRTGGKLDKKGNIHDPKTGRFVSRNPGKSQRKTTFPRNQGKYDRNGALHDKLGRFAKKSAPRPGTFKKGVK
jgi:hypothetical protein